MRKTRRQFTEADVKCANVGSEWCSISLTSQLEGRQVAVPVSYRSFECPKCLFLDGCTCALGLYHFSTASLLEGTWISSIVSPRWTMLLPTSAKIVIDLCLHLSFHCTTYSIMHVAWKLGHIWCKQVSADTAAVSGHSVTL